MEAFAADYRLTPAPVVNELTIDPAAPPAGGVRLVELNSSNFVDDSDEITPDQAQQLNRVVVAMESFPDSRSTSSATRICAAMRRGAWCSRNGEPRQWSSIWWARGWTRRA